MSRLSCLLQRMNWLAENAPSTGAEVGHDIAPDRLPQLDEIPVDQVLTAPESRLVYHTDPHSVAAESFRLMRMRLQTPWFAGRMKKLLVTSALPGDGKSTVALNLATALSEQGKRTVLLIEADFHHSSLSQMLGVRPGPGLAESLESSFNPLGAVRHLMPVDWYLLPAGHATMNPAELFQGAGLPKVMGQLSAHFDWLVLDSPPVMLLSEALSLREQSDASLLVVRAGRTSQDVVEDAIARLGRQHVLAVILNGVGLSGRESSNYAYRNHDRSASRAMKSQIESGSKASEDSRDRSAQSGA